MFEHSKTLLGNKTSGLNKTFGNVNNDYDDETRSMRSEFDYENKKKFVDIIGHKNNNTSLRFDNQQKQSLDKDFDNVSIKSKKS